jgi:NADH dehydrogenase
MLARIFQPAKTAMSSGQGKTKVWILEFSPAERREVDPLMGWTSSGDTQSQVRMRFDSKEAAEAYAKDHGIEATVQEPNKRKPNIRARGYAENFAVDRRTPWTH